MHIALWDTIAGRQMLNSAQSSVQKWLKVFGRTVPVPADIAGGVDQDNVGLLFLCNSKVGAPELFVLGEDDKAVLFRRGQSFAHGSFDHSANEAWGRFQRRNLVGGRSGECRVGANGFGPVSAGWPRVLAESGNQYDQMTANGIGEDQGLAAQGFTARPGNSGSLAAQG